MLNKHQAPAWLEYPTYLGDGRDELRLSRSPKQVLLENCWVSIEADEAPAPHYVASFGDDNVAFSTDYPHPDSKFPKAVDRFLALQLSDATKRKFLWDNCARLYGLEG